MRSPVRWAQPRDCAQGRGNGFAAKSQGEWESMLRKRALLSVTGRETEGSQRTGLRPVLDSA